VAYANAYATPRDAQQGFVRCLMFYNDEQSYQALNQRTPVAVSFQRLAGHCGALAELVG
jgi:hypothetical protein